MPKILIASFPEKCTGCELCIMEAQRQLNKAGLEGSLIRVFRKREKGPKIMEFLITSDPQINVLDVEKIRDICPNGVFEVEEKDAENELIS